MFAQDVDAGAAQVSIAFRIGRSDQVGELIGRQPLGPFAAQDDVANLRRFAVLVMIEAEQPIVGPFQTPFIDHNAVQRQLDRFLSHSHRHVVPIARFQRHTRRASPVVRFSDLIVRGESGPFVVALRHPVQANAVRFDQKG